MSVNQQPQVAVPVATAAGGVGIEPQIMYDNGNGAIFIIFIFFIIVIALLSSSNTYYVPDEYEDEEEVYVVN